MPRDVQTKTFQLFYKMGENFTPIFYRTVAKLIQRIWAGNTERRSLLTLGAISCWWFSLRSKSDIFCNWKGHVHNHYIHTHAHIHLIVTISFTLSHKNHRRCTHVHIFVFNIWNARKCVSYKRGNRLGLSFLQAYLVSFEKWMLFVKYMLLRTLSIEVLFILIPGIC